MDGLLLGVVSLTHQKGASLETAFSGAAPVVLQRKFISAFNGTYNGFHVEIGRLCASASLQFARLHLRL